MALSQPAGDSRPTLADRVVGGPAGFRRRLERLGPIFIKMGQFLALRPDLIPQEYCDELMTLLDRVPPFPWPQALEILHAELKDDPRDIFTTINPVPVAAGSLAQVHLARFPDGTEVAIKILRPGIAARVQRDLRRARRLTRLLEISGVSLVASPREVLDELSDWLMQEIDLDHELANVTRLYRLTRSSSIERVPQPFPAFSTARVLTLEYLHGVPFTDLLTETPSAAQSALLRRLDIDRAQLAANLLRATLGQIFRYRFFHVDLHPGNLIALPGNIIGYVDFGLCDALADTVRERQLRYLSAIYNRDIDAMFRALTDIVIARDDSDLESFRTDFYAQATAYLGRRSDPMITDGRRATGERSPIADWMVQVVRSARRNRLQFPANILSLYRALLTSEAVARQLDPQANLRTVGREFFQRMQLEELLGDLRADRLQPMLLSLLTLWRDAPRQMQQILADAAEGRLAVNVDVSESPRTRRQRNRRTKLVVAAALAVGVSLLLGGRTLPTVLGIPLAWPLVGLLVLLYLVVLWQWRQLR